MNVHIYLDRYDSCVYHAGEVITGKIRLSCDHAITVKVIYIELLGRTVVVAPWTESIEAQRRWTKQRASLHRRRFVKQGSGCIVRLVSPQRKCDDAIGRARELKALRTVPPIQARQVQPSYRTVNEEINCSAVVTILGIDMEDGHQTILTGQHVYPFIFHLPDQCPSTFTGSRGSVEYRLKSTVELSTGRRVHSTRGFAVIRDLVVGTQLDLPSTMSCPPISQNFVSSFDFFKVTGNSNHLTELVRQHKRNPGQLECSISSSDESCCSIPDTPRVTNRYKRSRGNSHRSKDDSENGEQKSILQSLKEFIHGQQVTDFGSQNFIYRRQSLQSDMISLQSDGRKVSRHPSRKDKFQSLICSVFKQTDVKRSNRPRLHISRCADNTCLLPATWFSREQTGHCSIYPTTCPGTQLGHAISCRLTISRRQVIPGDDLTLRLTLMVEDPFAMLLLPMDGSHSSDPRAWFAKLTTKDHKQLFDRIWSPLAKVFVTYFLDNDIQGDASALKARCSDQRRKSLSKRPHRIFSILRQLVTYRGHTGHVIAEEERDVYCGEIHGKRSADKHLLGAVLEHKIRIPPISPSGLDGCSCIDVSYTVGVVLVRLKRRLLAASRRFVSIQDSCEPLQSTAGIEQIYLPNSSLTNNESTIKWKAPMLERMKWSKVNHRFRGHCRLELPISLTIGTGRETRVENTVQMRYHVADEMLYPGFHMQWPKSCEKGSLPPIYVDFNDDLELSGKTKSNSPSIDDLEKLRRAPYSDEKGSDRVRRHSLPSYMHYNRSRPNRSASIDSPVIGSKFSINQTDEDYIDRLTNEDGRIGPLGEPQPQRRTKRLSLQPTIQTK